MKETDGRPLKKGPILGIDNLGTKKLMRPGGEYKFPGNTVFEVPLAQKGIEVPKRNGGGILTYKNNSKRRGEVIDFGTDKETAIKFGEGSWKTKMQSGGTPAMTTRLRARDYDDRFKNRYVPFAQEGYSVQSGDTFWYIS